MWERFPVKTVKSVSLYTLYQYYAQTPTPVRDCASFSTVYVIHRHGLNFTMYIQHVHVHVSICEAVNRVGICDSYPTTHYMYHNYNL